MTPFGITTRTRWSLAAVVVIALGGCEPPGKPNPADRPVLPNQINDFARLYALNCSGCHGMDGKLGPAPPLADPLFASIVPDEALLEVIRSGRKGTPMPAFAIAQGGALTDEQLKVLAGGIKSHWRSDDDEVRTNSPTYAIDQTAAASSDETRGRGTAAYDRACAGCHGANGQGIDSDGTIANALNVPAFLALISDQALRRIIITGRQDLGMPNFAESDGRPDDFQPLTSAEINEIVALLASWRTAGAVTASADNAEQTQSGR
jgi:mono/diheme cytochrome c family protein